VSRKALGRQGIDARFSYAVVVGPIAKLELLIDASVTGQAPVTTSGDAIIEAHVPAREFLAMQLQEGEPVVLSPRRARVFVGNEALDTGLTECAPGLVGA
jgi:sulfate transport system ATP-binding protein